MGGCQDLSVVVLEVWAGGAKGRERKAQIFQLVSLVSGVTSGSHGLIEIPRPPANMAWRPTRTASGNFEGVLGFGGSAITPSNAPTQPTTSSSGSPATPTTTSFDSIAQPAPIAVKEKEKEPSDAPIMFGAGGGPGWGSGQKKWRIAAGLSNRDGDRVGSTRCVSSERCC
jgi:hypothetical protein